MRITQRERIYMFNRIQMINRSKDASVVVGLQVNRIRIQIQGSTFPKISDLILKIIKLNDSWNGKTNKKRD